MGNPMLRRIGIVVSIVSALVLILSLSLAGVLADTKLDSGGTDGNQAVIAASTASLLHNPTFDNHDWYEFNGRYGNYLAGTWLPDDDGNGDDNIPLSSRQDWRIWFQDGTDVLEADPETTYAQSVQGVQVRAYGDSWNSGHHLGGLYQVIYNTTPCLEYEFKMNAQARYEPPHDQIPDPFPTDWVNTLRVGIDRTGWHLATNDPAVHGDFPATTKWGESQKHYWEYGELSATAEAWADEVAVFTYADADGGRASRVLWDTGSFAEVTPAQIYDPADYTVPNGIYSLSSSVAGSSVLITWNTSKDAISQVYYHSLPTASPPPTTTYTNTVYLPLVVSNAAWQSTDLKKEPTSSHSFTLSGLEAGMTYEYIVVSKAYVSGDACSIWVKKDEFTTP